MPPLAPLELLEAPSPKPERLSALEHP